MNDVKDDVDFPEVDAKVPVTSEKVAKFDAAAMEVLKGMQVKPAAKSYWEKKK